MPPSAKAGLYRQALTRYEETLGCLDVTAIGSAASLPEAVRVMLEGAVANVTRGGHERGCMISSGLVACHPDHAALADDAAARREALRGRIAEALSGFAADCQIRRLARHLAAVMQGLSIQARDGVATQELQEIVADVVAGIAARFPDKRRLKREAGLGRRDV